MPSKIKYEKWPSFSQEEIEIANNILTSGKVNYWTGPYGKNFESEFAKYVSSKYAVSVANGTLALELALRALGIKQGDEVIVTPRSFIASVSCIVSLGGKPVFSDIEINSGNLSAKSIKEKITKKTKAILCVHLGGWPCEMKEIMKIANEHEIYVIEDCAQAHGAKYNGDSVGSIGHIGAWSFCQDKIMSTAGEGGMLTTNSRKLWEKIWSYKDHGKDYQLVNAEDKSLGFKWLHKSFGSNYRMTEIQSAIGSYQLTLLDSWKASRTSNANSLIEAMKKFESFINIPVCPDHMENAFYRLYAYIIDGHTKPGWDRDKIVYELNNIGVPAFQGSCPEIYLERAFDKTDFKPKERLINAKKLGLTSIAFLVHPTLTNDDINDMKDKIQHIMTLASKNH
mgnify:CR=1 FL=1|tara:strand:- start:647 stop:1834 length:1188 start_codon:yes stop_codon:yes gene_type:complete